MRSKVEKLTFQNRGEEPEVDDDDMVDVGNWCRCGAYVSGRGPA